MVRHKRAHRTQRDALAPRATHETGWRDLAD
jgi:hypothetical protein